MKCGEFAEMVHELVRPGDLDPAEAAIARAHAEICPGCNGLLAEAETLAAMLHQTSLQSRALGAPEPVESQIMAAFRAAMPAKLRRRWIPGWRLALGCAGAAAALSFAVFAWRGRSPDRRSSQAVRISAAVPAVNTAAGQQAAALPSAAQSVTLSTAQESNSVWAFVPVPFAGGFARGDSGVIVRVQLPKASLAELGYPVDETQGESVVQADLLVGEDGWPHAVRIVSQGNR